MQIYLGYNKVGQSSDYILTVLSNHQKGKASSIKTIEKALPFVYPPKRSSIPHEITTYLGKGQNGFPLADFQNIVYNNLVQ